jgi:hypothetical protein
MSAEQNINDPLQRRPSPAPYSSSPNVTFVDQITPRRPRRRERTASNTPSDSHSSSSSYRSPQPLIRLNDDDKDEAASDSASLREDEEMNYGATSNAPDNEQRMHRGNRPDRIRMPPAPYSRSAAGDEAVSDTSLLTPGGHSVISAAAPRSRQMSFKKRRPSARSATDQNSNFLKRASMGVFGRSANSPNESPRGGPDARARARQMRQAQTMSVHPNDDNAENQSSWERKPKIPSMIPSVPANSTPIPTVPFVVLCLVCFGEFSSAGVAGPFLFFQIDSFNVGGEKEVAKWAGIVSAVFFFAQFLTSLLWSSAAQKHGRRSVLLVSLIGNAASLILFGMSQNLPFAISVRLAQGLFNGAVGVAKGAIRDLTDETNEGRAMGQLGFAWGMGGIVGPLLGGILCNPVEKFPWLFKDSTWFKEYPYLLPCLVVSSFMAVGALLCLFIGPDGGPRTGAIHLPEKVDVERAIARAATNVGSFGRIAGKRTSGYFGGHAEGANASSVSLTSTNVPDGGRPNNHLSRTFTQQVDEETGGPPSPVESDSGTITTAQAGYSGFDQRSLMSKTRARQHNILEGGSAYGYADLTPGPSTSVRDRRASMAQSSRIGGGPNMRNSIYAQSQYAPDLEELHAKQQKLSFAQRFLLANDDAVLALSDLWVAAAINNDADYEDEEDDFGYDGYLDEEDELEDEEEEQETLDDSIEGSDINESTGSRVFGHDDIDEDSLLVPRHLPPVNFARKNRQTSMASSSASRPFGLRGTNRIPSLYANTGVENALLSPGVSAVGPLPGMNRQDGPAGGYDPTLAGIPESGSVHGSMRGKPGSSGVTVMTHAGAVDPSPSLFRQLPLVFIAHYALMALHSSTFDQVFMAFLVTPVKFGGLGLTAAHYAELIAAMAFCQIGFQFYFYPVVGPPLGKLSHLAMMRLGTSLYLCYILFAFLRAFLHPSTDVLVMTFMILFASIRWLANVCAFTAVSVLMNATTPPHLIALANGLAQTTSSAARFVGPLIGGELVSIF